MHENNKHKLNGINGGTFIISDELRKQLDIKKLKI